MRKRAALTKRAESLLIATVVILAGIQAAQLAQRVSPQQQQQQAESCSGLGCVFPEAYALSSVPAEYLSFQGQLTSNTGSPITTSTVFDLSLWDCQTCTTTSPDLIYNETQTITPDSRGLFYIEIGCGGSCSSYDGATASAVGSPAGAQTWPPSFTAAYWLAVRIYPGGAGVAYLSPRIAINGAPYVTGEVPWGQLTSFPSACSAGQAVTSIGSSPACATFMQSVASTSCAALSAVTSASSTTVNCGPDATISSTSCAAGSFVNQAATTTVSCSTAPSTISSTSCGANSFVNTASSTTVGCAGQYLGVSSTSCAAGNAITSATGTAVTCGAEVTVASTTISCSSQSYVTTVSASASVVNAACNQPLILLGPATTSQLMSSNAFTTVTALQASVAASTYYAVTAYIPYSCSAGDARFGVTAPAGTVLSLNFDQEISGTADLQYQETTTSTSGSTSTAVCPASPGLPMIVTGYIETSTTAGTFGFLFEDATNADTMTVFAGAWLQLSNPAA